MDENNNGTITNNSSYDNYNQQVMTVGEWILTFIICAIPCVNVIMLFVWAFGSGNENRKNYAKAALIMSVIGIIISIIVTVAFGSVFAEVLNNLQSF